MTHHVMRCDRNHAIAPNIVRHLAFCLSALGAVVVMGCGGAGDAVDGNATPSAANNPSGGSTPTSGGGGAVDLSKLTSPVSNAPVGQQTERKSNAVPAEQRNPPRH